MKIIRILMITILIIMLIMMNTLTISASSCTSGDEKCESGTLYVCEAGTWMPEPPCNDDNFCTADSCGPTGPTSVGCTYTNTNEGVQCNTNPYKICVSGKCDFDSSIRYVCATTHTGGTSLGCEYEDCFGTYDCEVNQACMKYYSSSGLPGEGGLKTCYLCIENNPTCCTSARGLYLTPSNHCCPLGSYWSTTSNLCKAQNKCGLSTECTSRPPNDPNGWQKNPYLANNKCVTLANNACCYFDNRYGEDDVYYYENIIIY